MRKVLLSFVGVLFLVCIGLLLNKPEESKNIAELRKKHEEFLRNSPFKETLKLSKKERKAKGIPPNKYMERQWELTMNPSTGKPEPEKVFALQEQLTKNALFAKVPGEKTNNWVERGPNNVGGRTRAIMFDPNDATNKRVFAGGVSGGLWVNNDITLASSAWSEVDIPANLAISCITYDPNNTMTFYVGTGEAYVQGSVNGNGVWKSTNGGTSWSRVFGGVTGDTDIISGVTDSFNARVIVNTPSGIAGNYFGSRAGFGVSLTPITGNLVLADDGSATPNEACGALVNAGAISGNIAVLYRGNCDFSQKVLNAQNAGATAVIVVNNVADAIITMAAGGAGDSVTIPSLMISMADGQTLINQLGSGVNVSMNGYTNYSGYTAKPGVQHINDIKVRDIGGGNSEVYVAATTAFYKDASPTVFLGPEDYGLFKSTNAGGSWTKFPLLSSNVNDFELVPNDIEISADNTIWLSTTGDALRQGGGEILSSTDGVNFTLEYKVSSGKRTQIAVSGTDASKLYILSETSSETTPVTIIHTDDGFATTTSLPLPVAAPGGFVPAIDFTNGQAFYNLMIEVDPTNDAILYVGGIDLYRSADSGNVWNQISEYYTSNASISDVHPDQHAFTFNPSDPTKAVNGNDGGVYYASSLSGTPAIISRNKNYNTLQFYNGAIGQEVGTEKLLAGAQDNGTLFMSNAAPGINGSTETTGGDGTYVFIDKDNEYIITSVQQGQYYYSDYATGISSGYTIEGNPNGDAFVNPAELDSDSNILFSAGSGSINRYKLDTGSAVADSFTNSGITTTSVTSFKASPYSSNALFVGTENGRLFKVTLIHRPAGSQTWTEITGNSFVGSISSIELGATDNEIFVTFYNYGVTSVFYTANGGSTWQNKEGNLPDLPVRAIMLNPLNSNEVIIATDLGVWGSPDFNNASPNWYQADNGMKDVRVNSFDLRTADNTVLAATYGRGMFTGQFTADASSLSVGDEVLNDLIKIYPTVSNGNFKISARNEISNGTLSVFDLNGREVYTSKVDFNRNSVQNVSLNASSGLYVIKFKSDNRQSTYKIIIE